MLGNICIGSGMPKIIVPIAERTRDGVLAMARELARTEADAVEWRADFYEDLRDREAVAGLLCAVREALGGKPLIFTCRTAKEGGGADMSHEEYAALCRAAVHGGKPHGIDIEVLSHGEHSAGLISEARAAGCTVIGSCHTDSMPSPEKTAQLLTAIGNSGADIVKLAAMARTPKEAAAMAEAAAKAAKWDMPPIIAIAMGEAGCISRILAEPTGSAAVFASVGKGSAPGQLPLETMSEILRLVHNSL